MEFTKDQTAMLGAILQNKMTDQQNRGIQPLTFVAQLLLTKDADRFPILEGWFREMKLQVLATIGALDLNRIQAEQKLRAKDGLLDFLITTVSDAVEPADPAPAVPVEPAVETAPAEAKEA